MPQWAFFFAEYSSFFFAFPRLTRRLVHFCYHSFHLSHPSPLPLFSLLPPVSLFLLTLPTVSPSPSLCRSVILPRLFYLPLSFFLPICFLFSAVSSTALLCFSSSDPTLEHLREIRRKLASENLQLKAPVPRLLSRSQRNILKHSDLVRLCLRNKLLVVARLVALFDASIRGMLPQPPSPDLPNQGLVSSDVTG